MAKTHSSLTTSDLHHPKGFSVESTASMFVMSQSISTATASFHFIPDDTDTYTLGNTARAWKELYVSTGSIHFVEKDGTVARTLEVDATGFGFGGGDVSGSTISGSKLHIVGDAFIGGDLTLGDADTDSISIGADITSNLIPNADATYDLGSSSKGWNDIHLGSGGVINLDGGDVTLTHAAGKITLGGDGAVEFDFADHEMTNVDIDGGAIDGTAIGAASHTTIKGTTIDATTDFTIGGTVITDNTITDDGTLVIASTTATSFSDGNITNVGDINADSLSVDDAAVGLDINFGGNTTLNKITLTDNLADALNINEGGTSYIKFTTTDSSEQIVVGKNSTFNGTTIADLGTVTTANIDGGTVDGTTIGASSHTTIKGTTIDATTDFTIGGTVITDGQIAEDGNFTMDIAGDLSLDVDGGDVTITDDGAPILTLNATTISGSATASGSFAHIAVNSVSASRIEVDSIQGNWTNAGNTVADLGSITTVDINGGTINGITDLAVADGGTGASTLTDGGVLLGSGTGAITATAVLANGELLIGDNSTDPTVATLTGTANQINVTNGGGSITLSTPQSIDTSADVTFDSLTLDDLTATRLVASDGSEKLISTDASMWITGSSNQITVTGANGYVTLSTPQSIDTSADVTFDSLTLDDLTAGRVVFSAADGLLSDDSDFTFSTDTLTVTKLGAYEQAGSVDFSDEAMTNVNIDSGAIDGTVIGAATPASGSFTGIIVTGGMEVRGNLTYVSSSNLDIGDRIVTLNASSAAGDGGLYINDADTTETGSLLWDVSEDRWIGGLKDAEVNLVTLSSTDTLTNKTLTSPDINGGTWNGTVDGNSTAAGITWADLGSVTTVDINGGAIDGTAIGAASHTTIKGTTIDATTDFTIDGLVLTADTITNDSNLTMDLAGDLAIDVDGGDVTITDNGADLLTINATTISGSSTSTGSFAHVAVNSVSASRIDFTQIDGAWTNAGNTVADLGSITTVDINGGTVDGATIATSDITVGSGKTLDVSGGTLTLAADQISGNAINGGTISGADVDDTTAANIVAQIDNDEIPIAKLAEDAVTITAGDGLKTGGSVTLGSSVTLDVDVSDFAGTGLEGDGSENLRLATQGTGISGGAGSTLSITPGQTAITSVINDGLTIGGYSSHQIIDFGTDDMIKVSVNNVADEFRFSAGGTFHADADVVAYSSTTASDISLKKNITDTKYGLDDIMKLRGVDYDWRREDMGHDVGVLAQEVEKVIPEIVKEYDGMKGRPKFKAVDYNKLVPVLIESIKELKKEIDDLKSN